MLTQNGIAERANQTIENLIRALLKDLGLPNKFQVKAAETDVYIRNLRLNGLEVDSIKISLEEAFTRTKLLINYLRVQGCKVVSFLNPKSLP